MEGKRVYHLTYGKGLKAVHVLQSTTRPEASTGRQTVRRTLPSMRIDY